MWPFNNDLNEEIILLNTEIARWKIINGGQAITVSALNREVANLKDQIAILKAAQTKPKRKYTKRKKPLTLSTKLSVTPKPKTPTPVAKKRKTKTTKAKA